MSRYRIERFVDTIIIHCAATPNGRPHTAKDVDFWHGKGRQKQGIEPFKRSSDARIGKGKWEGRGQHAIDLKHIGYHFVIPLHGATEVGRRLTETGAHARGHNQHSIGICVIGTDKFTEAQWDTLKALVNGLLHQWKTGYNKQLRVIGHRQVNTQKTCPGFDVPAWLENKMEPLADHLLEESNGP